MEKSAVPEKSPSKHETREREARRRVLADDKDLRARAKLADALLCQDRLQEASLEFAKVAVANQTHPAAHKGLAAIANYFGHPRRGRRIMQDFYERVPVELDPYGADRPEAERPPAIVQIRGFDKTRIMLGSRSDGSISTKLRGGHFTTKFLLLDPPFQVHRFTISRGNILRPDVMPPHSLILNTIADADIEGSSLDSLQEYLDQNVDAVVINRPERVANTTRDRNATRLSGIDGLTFPRTHRVRFENAKPDKVARMVGDLEFEYPFLIRRTGTQTGRSFARIKTREDLDAYVGERLNSTYFLIEYRKILWKDKLFRKLRLFHIDGTFFPVVCHLDKMWNVHGGNRKTIMRDDETLMAEEKSFLEDWKSYVGARNVGCIEAIAELIGLEFFGMDFTIDQNGEIFIYELNPAMRHSFDHARDFPYKMPHDQAISNAFQAMILNRIPQRDRPAVSA
jgi:hypothetical protein